MCVGVWVWILDSGLWVLDYGLQTAASGEVFVGFVMGLEKDGKRGNGLGLFAGFCYWITSFLLLIFGRRGSEGLVNI